MKNPVVKILLVVSLLIILVIAAYVVGIGTIGGASFSLSAEDWVNFSNYFNDMLSPILAALAAVIAYYSLSHQIRIAREDSSLSEQISNYLNNINTLKNIIDKRWNTVAKVCQRDYEEETFPAININNIKDSLKSNAYLAPEVIRLAQLFHDLEQAVLWYTNLHERKIELKKENFPRKEWVHFSLSLIREQEKKMKFCYEYCQWLHTEPSKKTENYGTEVIIYTQFYENLCSNGTLFKS
jgi:hypothetical protein